MHLLAAKPGEITDGSEAVDLGQTPGDIVILSAADSELAGIATAYAADADNLPSLRLANLMQLGHNLSVDIYTDDIIASAKLVVIRLLGGVGYWNYGVERVTAICRARDIALAILPGDDQPDAELVRLSRLPADICHRLWQYCIHGGQANFRNLLAYCATLTGQAVEWAEPAPVPRAGIYWPGLAHPDLRDLAPGWQADAPVCAIVFYRALMQGGNLAPIDALIVALREAGLNPLPLYVTSLKDPVSAELVAALLADARADIVLNATGFAVATPGEIRAASPFDGCDCPILQIVLAGGSEESWREGFAGLGARDIAMNVALPEVDGRILSRAISFKAEARYDAATQCAVVTYAPIDDRVRFVAALAANWVRLRHTPVAQRRVAIILANYPNRDGRIGNGVGLDTPAGTINVLRAMAARGYAITDMPEDGAALVARILAGPTNAIAGRSLRRAELHLSLADYRAYFDALPDMVRMAMCGRWGQPEDDPFFSNGQFALSAFRIGNIVIGLQPARGYQIDPVSSYHDPDLVPPHGYAAFYAWLRLEFGAHAMLHMGKHGNMEWLPGKALALSEACYPEAMFGPTPHLYPFIVNDPGEGTQAKRRAQAVIIDHLTPPMTRAETYGPLADLERLVDEYYEAAGVDPRRVRVLGEEILRLTVSAGLDRDCGILPEDGEDDRLAKLDNYLCELKELQIRDGLHIFGTSPQGRQLTDLLVALVRVPRGAGEGGDASLIRALAEDAGFGSRADFDPLDCRFSDPCAGPRPAIMGPAAGWRSLGDTVERLEILAGQLVAGTLSPPSDWHRTRAVLATLECDIRPAVAASGEAEIAAVLKGLDGRFVEPGPSGAPTRGRIDVLPTGRNFYSVDSRTVPTAAAWHLGWKSAGLLLARHRQEHGEWPCALAISAWGTANMRTGGDDLAQALALLGVRPEWDAASRRVTGFEILPLSVLDRPRVDVMFRISGFFRDAFPQQIALFDSAVRAVAALDEPDADNPLAARYRQEMAAHKQRGMDEAEAAARAGYRIFGSKPGAYGAGLQALMDERGWENEEDLARAYIAWGGYAYGAGAEGRPAHGLFETRLAQIDAVVQNQDNREHDLLDSDDYYQFEGGLAVAVAVTKGSGVPVWHNDHSRPESPKIRSLEEEIARVVRARVVNPKWIESAMRHGYKGAFEMAATVDYLVAFAATARAVADHHFDAVFDAYLGDERVCDFLRRENPDALREMAQKLREAQDRGLWQPRANSIHPQLEALIERKGRNADG